jgi:CheY-like chemotaxis protein
LAVRATFIGEIRQTPAFSRPRFRSGPDPTVPSNDLAYDGKEQPLSRIGLIVVTTILIADGHHVVRSGLRALSSEQANWQVVADAANGEEAVEQAIKTTPDVAIVDYSLPSLNGTDVTRQIRKGSPATEVLIFTTRDDSSVVQDVLRAGALGYLLKSDANNLPLRPRTRSLLTSRSLRAVSPRRCCAPSSPKARSMR